MFTTRRFFYRPQTKFAKVMFLHPSVSHSVHRGRGVCLGPHPRGGWGSGLGVSRPTPRGFKPHPGVFTGGSRPTPMVVHSWVCLGPHTGGGWGSGGGCLGHTQGGGWGVRLGPHLGGVQAHTWGVSRPHWGCSQGVQAHTWGRGSRPTPGEGGSRPTSKGEVGGLAGRVSRPPPGGVQAQAHGGVSQHALRQTPPTPSIQLLLQVVGILLECILVFHHFELKLFSR